MDLIILEGLDITIDLSEIAMMKGIKIDNPTYIPAMPDKGIVEQGGAPYFEQTEITLRCGESVVVELPYSQFVMVIKKWMTVNGGMNRGNTGDTDESSTVDSDSN